MSEHVTDGMAGANRDFSVSTDAMRWTPPPRSNRFYDRGADELRNIDMYDDRLSYPEAAIVAGVPEATVRQWKSRHDLAPVEIDDNGRLRFRPVDVMRAEAKTHATPQGRKRKAS